MSNPYDARSSPIAARISSEATSRVRMCGRTVVKTFGTGSADDAGREWRALVLLARYAPSLAPAPVSARLGDDRPEIVMGRLAGTPLGEVGVRPVHLDALATALRALHTAVPRAALPAEPLRSHELHRRVVRMAARQFTVPTAEAGDDDLVSAAHTAGVRWLETWEPNTHGVVPVFGLGDHNLTNFLWDGQWARIVDFEDSGRSDRPFELADLVEHVAVVHRAGIDAPELLSRFVLTAAELRRLAALRKLAALFWLMLLIADARRDRPRNPAGTANDQARRLLTLLSA